MCVTMATKTDNLLNNYWNNQNFNDSLRNGNTCLLTVSLKERIEYRSISEAILGYIESES